MIAEAYIRHGLARRELKMIGGKTLFVTAFLAVLAAVPTVWSAERSVVATIAQIGQPLEVITAGRVRVESLAGEGVDPHLYRLTRSDVLKLVRADLILYNGFQLEAQMLEMLERLSRRKPVVAVAEVLGEDCLRSDRGGTCDPHVWMDPVLWIRALDAGVDALAKVDPDNAPTYRRNASAYFDRLRLADARARSSVLSIAPSRRVLLTAHDAFGYFGRTYGLEVLPVQGISTESEVGLRRIGNLVDILTRRRVTAVFVETSVSERHVRALIEGAAVRGHGLQIGGRLYSDALGPANSLTGTYLGMFDHNVRTIVKALGGSASGVELVGQMVIPDVSR